MKSPVSDFLRSLHEELSGLREGEVATYIPELAKADPAWFGICVATAKGHVYEAGDAAVPFTIQSISKPFVYGLALEDNGPEAVLARVGVEPSGDAFNSISLEPETGRPLNPMINAGAIATAGLIQGGSPASRLRRVLHGFSTFAGRSLAIDEEVYRSESQTGHRNRAIGHMLRNFGILDSDPAPTVELYFQQCSISVTCRDLAVMAATLANRGVNPLTGRQAVRGDYVTHMLSVMSTCGMYDWSGEWIYTVGMPAKSGVAGGIIAVLPGQLGIAVFSPLLDSHGNSVRGIKVCEALSRRLDLHLFNRRETRDGSVRLAFDGSKVSSRRIRAAEETAVLSEEGHRIQVVQLQGHLTFATTETAVHAVQEREDFLRCLVLDFQHVLSINDTAARLLYETVLSLAGNGKTTLFTHLERVPLLGRVFRTKLGQHAADYLLAFDDNDPALEYCEDRILEERGLLLAEGRTAALEEFDLLEGMSPAEVDLLAGVLEPRAYAKGESIVRAGEEAGELFLLQRGRVSIYAGRVDQGGAAGGRRLATVSAGMVFGEMSLLDRSPRSATAVADSEVACGALSAEVFEKLAVEHPGIKIRFLENLARGISRNLRKANVELSVFE